MKSPLRVLHLEDDPLDVEFIASSLAAEAIACSIFRVETRDAFIAALDPCGFDIILADYSLPGFDGLSALAIAHERCPNIPFIFISGTMGEELAIETLKSGATDYVLKNRISRLGPSVLRALSEAAERADRRKAVEDLRESREQLRNLAAHLESVREEERTSISREIHDELGQALTALKIDLSLIAAKLPAYVGSETLTEQLKSDVTLINTTIQAVKRICTRLRPAILDHLGLVAAVEWQVEEFQRRTKTCCVLVSDLDSLVVENNIATALFRILQETLTNVMRHAEATTVKVSLLKLNGNIELSVQDDGKGCADCHLTKVQSFGLTGIRERVRSLGGSFEMKGSNGTTITVCIPLTRE